MQEKLKRITVLGAGLLVGTALTVIIPEGVRSLTIVNADEETNTNPDVAKVTDNHKTHDPFAVIGISLVLGFVFMLLVDQVSVV